ncbi:hypothetical protein [Bradyrhizobium sp.]|uniref:hypothetical protein n=1 Tax=Bradyrhizobium sp. TaxID=376 RepID=UPI002637B00B|nr:hypothetical protein [Bradyrhizobium sp.]
MVSTEQFRQEIRSRLERASAQGGQHLTIECGELYRSVSSPPVSNRWMIFCCNAMRAEMAISDEVIFDYATKETLLKVKYRLPRTKTRPPVDRGPE